MADWFWGETTAAKLFVALRCFIPELMVEMGSPDQMDIAGGVELAQDPREGHRIRPAGYRGDHTRVRRP